MSLVIDLIDLVAKHKAGELRCPATALILSGIINLIREASNEFCKIYHIICEHRIFLSGMKDGSFYITVFTG